METDLNDLRRRVLAGEELTVEEYQVVLNAKRASRHAAAESALKKAPAKRKVAKTLMSLSEMDALLEKL